MGMRAGAGASRTHHRTDLPCALSAIVERNGSKKRTTMRADVKQLTHWIIYRGYKVSVTQRKPYIVDVVLTTPTGEIVFRYDPVNRRIFLADVHININEYGWELNREQT